MDDDLAAYIERIKPLGEATGERGGHRIASALLSFAMGMYDRTVERCDRSIVALEKREAHRTVVAALRILREHARSLVATQVSVRSAFTFEGTAKVDSPQGEGNNAPQEFSFGGDDRAYLLLPEPDEEVAPPAVVARDNALLLLYAVAYTASADEAQALEEQVAPLLAARLDYYREEH
ncbi:MAG: hypothetical protein QCH35_05205 [Methanomicrobiaceae archaeon]|nr:hypothetical protein [Methanomicrobiaceae archaeon]